MTIDPTFKFNDHHRSQIDEGGIDYRSFVWGSNGLPAALNELLIRTSKGDQDSVCLKCKQTKLERPRTKPI